MKDSTILMISEGRRVLGGQLEQHTARKLQQLHENHSTTFLLFLHALTLSPLQLLLYLVFKHNKMQISIEVSSPGSAGPTPIQIPSQEPMHELADVKLLQAMDRKAKLFFQSESSKLKALKSYMTKISQAGIEPRNIEELKTYDIPQEILSNLTPKKVLQQSQSRFQRMAKTSKIKRNWSIGDLTILLYLISTYSQTEQVPLAQIHNDPTCWKFINDLITCTTPEQCLFRWMGFKKYRVTDFAWSDQEDYLLKSLEKKHRDHTNKWKLLAQQLYKLNPSTEKIYRQAKQCKEHFNSFLDPTIKKGLWSKQEDLLLFSAYIKFGCKRRWCLINKFFRNRTENSLKNRFQLLHNRIMKDTVLPEDEPFLIRKYIDSLRTQIRKLELEDQLVLIADNLLKEPSSAKIEEEDSPLHEPSQEVEIPAPAKPNLPSQGPLYKDQESEMVVKTEQVEEMMHQLPIKEVSRTPFSIQNCSIEQQQRHHPYPSYCPFQFFEAQTMQSIAFPYYNRFYPLPYYPFSSATSLESNVPALRQAFQQQR